MAKEAAPTGKLADRIDVRHHSSHENVPDQAEVLVSGKRVGYISYGVGHPFTILPADYLGIKVKPAELKEIVAVARTKVAELAKVQADERAEMDAVLAGEL